MSFILDALRKSEHERQRQTGPALAEVPVAAPKPRSNVWATGAIALLLVNLVVIGVLLIRKAAREPEATVPAAMPAPTQAAPAATAPAPAQVTMTQTVPSGTVAAPPPMLQPARSAGPPADGSRNSLEEEMSEGPPMLDPQMAADAAAAPAGPPAVTRAPSGRGSVVYESLPASAAVGARSGTPLRPSRARHRSPLARSCQRPMRSRQRAAYRHSTSTCTCTRPDPPSGWCSSTRASTAKATRCRKVPWCNRSRRTVRSSSSAAAGSCCRKD